nr:unnamed protein product [Callosobruchus analis]
MHVCSEGGEVQYLFKESEAPYNFSGGMYYNSVASAVHHYRPPSMGSLHNMGTKAVRIVGSSTLLQSTVGYKVYSTASEMFAQHKTTDLVYNEDRPFNMRDIGTQIPHNPDVVYLANDDIL